MTVRHSLVALSLILAGCRHDPAPDFAQLERQVVWEAVKAKNMDVLRQSFADDFVEVSDNGTFTKKDVLEIVPALMVQDYALRDFHTVTLTERSAVITYRVVQHWIFDGKPGP